MTWEERSMVILNRSSRRSTLEVTKKLILKLFEWTEEKWFSTYRVTERSLLYRAPPYSRYRESVDIAIRFFSDEL